MWCWMFGNWGSCGWLRMFDGVEVVDGVGYLDSWVEDAGDRV